MHTVLLVLFVINAITLVAFVLLQQGKGADAGAAFGSGASATVFGARGSANFLSRTTAVLAALFFVLAMTLAWQSQTPQAPESIAERMPMTRYDAQPQRIPEVESEALPTAEEALERDTDEPEVDPDPR